MQSEAKPFTKLAFLIALAATLGSLFLGEILKYPPCTLCWYQRICMYPLVLLFGVALWSGVNDYLKYSLPLIVIGLGISVYHNLLYYEVIPESVAPCSQGISCTSKQIEVFGLITIPLLSLASFTTLASIAVAELIHRGKE